MGIAMSDMEVHVVKIVVGIVAENHYSQNCDDLEIEVSIVLGTNLFESYVSMHDV
jgi:hypothetical protein